MQLALQVTGHLITALNFDGLRYDAYARGLENDSSVIPNEVARLFIARRCLWT